MFFTGGACWTPCGKAGIVVILLAAVVTASDRDGHADAEVVYPGMMRIKHFDHQLEVLLPSRELPSSKLRWLAGKSPCSYREYIFNRSIFQPAMLVYQLTNISYIPYCFRTFESVTVSFFPRWDMLVSWRGIRSQTKSKKKHR